MKPLEEELLFKATAQGDLRMRIYHPDGKASARRPVLVFFYGGGWRTGRLDQFEPQARHFAERGWLVFLPEYRIAGVHGTSPLEAVTDAKSAIRWILENLESYGGDPDRVVTGGGSAGAHLALATALVRDLNAPGEDGSRSTVPAALALFNPVVDATETGFNRHTLSPEDARRISPLHLLEGELPPAILFYGTADTITPFPDAERFYRAYREQGGDGELVAFDGLDHGFFNYGQHDNIPYQKTMSQLEAFLTRHGFNPENTAT